jgi:hypothetical protein
MWYFLPARQVETQLIYFKKKEGSPTCKWLCQLTDWQCQLLPNDSRFPSIVVCW